MSSGRQCLPAFPEPPVNTMRLPVDGMFEDESRCLDDAVYKQMKTDCRGGFEEVGSYESCSTAANAATCILIHHVSTPGMPCAWWGWSKGNERHCWSVQLNANTPPLSTLRSHVTFTCSLSRLYGCIFLSTQMTSGLMRRFSSSARTQFSRSTATSLTGPRILGLKQYRRSITDARPRQASVSRQWFTSSTPWLSPEPDECEKKRLNERNLKLGNSMSEGAFAAKGLWNTDNHSHPDFARSLTNATDIASTARHTLTAHYPPPIPVHTPSSPNRWRENCIYSSAMDSASRMGQGARARQCEAQDTI